MDQRRDGVAGLEESAQYGLKQMLPECFVSVKLETYEEGSCSDLQKYPAVQSTSTEDSSQSALISSQARGSSKEACCTQPNSTVDNPNSSKEASPHLIYQVQLPPPIMQQAQQGNPSRPNQGTPQAAQISHGTDATHVSQSSGSVNRTTPQQSAQAAAAHAFPHPHPRTSEIAWLSHSYVDQSSQHFHPHQMQYLPNDATLLTAIPPTQEGTRIVKQSTENQGGPTSVSCRADSNPATVAAVSASDSGDSNAFISYVLNPPRGVSSAGIFLFDASRGLPSQGSQIQSSSGGNGSRNDVQSGRPVDEAIIENSSDSVSTSDSPKPGESHLVSRSCQTVVTMSQIQDAPLLPDTKIIITDPAAAEMATEPEDSKDRVFAEADGEDSEEASSMDSENECENLKRVTRLGPSCSEYGNGAGFTHQHGTQNCHGRQNRASTSRGNGDQSNGVGGVLETLQSRGGTTQHSDGASLSRRNNGSEILGSGNFPFLESDRPFRCDICGNTYASQQALVNHERYHRGERPYECEICHKAFATNSHLVTHRRTHTGERPFQCQLCQRCFADRSAFVKHERTHGPNGSIIKRYKCDECGSGFVDSCGLKKHIRIHTGERPYVCNVCSKTFSTSSTFVAHKRIHTGERPYKCESCDKMFITKSHLLTHRRTHTGEKPFTCSVCNRCFTDGSSFRRHERLHTGENRHICMHCGRGFPLESSLQKHKQTHVQTGTFSYVYENRNDLNCLTPQQQQDSCDVPANRSARIPVSEVRDNPDRSICVDLSREISGEVQVNRNNLCADASREIDCDNQSAHSTVRVVG